MNLVFEFCKCRRHLCKLYAWYWLSCRRFRDKCSRNLCFFSTIHICLHFLKKSDGDEMHEYIPLFHCAIQYRENIPATGQLNCLLNMCKDEKLILFSNKQPHSNWQWAISIAFSMTMTVIMDETLENYSVNSNKWAHYASSYRSNRELSLIYIWNID